MTKKAFTINFDNFELPCMDTTTLTDEEEDLFSFEILLDMQGALPHTAIELGVINDEVDNWCSWKIEDYYYLLPWENNDFEWALIRISWDDNWSQYQWESCGRIAGLTEHWEAARALLKALFEDRYGFDLKTKEKTCYQHFIDNCKA